MRTYLRVHEIRPWLAAHGGEAAAVACLLVDAGMAPDDAIALTRTARHDTIERGSQVDFVHGWARSAGR
jgi:hypothetical protein